MKKTCFHINMLKILIENKSFFNDVLLKKSDGIIFLYPYIRYKNSVRLYVHKPE
jgi:hypothetical protein